MGGKESSYWDGCINVAFIKGVRPTALGAELTKILLLIKLMTCTPY